MFNYSGAALLVLTLCLGAFERCAYFTYGWLPRARGVAQGPSTARQGRLGPNREGHGFKRLSNTE